MFMLLLEHWIKSGVPSHISMREISSVPGRVPGFWTLGCKKFLSDVIKLEKNAI